MKHFSDEPLTEIIDYLTNAIADAPPRSVVECEVLNPDIAFNTYAGEEVTLEDKCYLYRSYKAWNDLAELLFCRLLTPKPASEHTVILRFEKLDIEDSFHTADIENKEEKYGVESRFFSINKNEEPAFHNAYAYALRNVGIENRKRILNLGINTGDEFELIRQLVDKETLEHIKLIGIDHSHSAIAHAKERFPDAELHVHDINALDELQLKPFDLIVTIGTLQSPGIDFKPFFMSLVQHYLSDQGALILGFPNCRWMGGEMIYGAKAPNYSYSEMSLLYKDVMFCKKYLQQHRFRVTLTGKNYVFLTATKIRPKS